MSRQVSKGRKQGDYYTHLAKKEKFPARSVYKLEEIQKKYRILKKENRVLDLGCAPGSWLLYVAGIIGSQGKAVGIDKKPITIKMPNNVTVYQGDISNYKEIFSLSSKEKYNVVLSDMAPDTTGNKFVDTARSFDLCRAALSIAENVLIDRGTFVCKIFQGEDFKNFSESVKSRFNKHKIFKPRTCRKSSKEIYIIGMGKK